MVVKRVYSQIAQDVEKLKEVACRTYKQCEGEDEETRLEEVICWAVTYNRSGQYILNTYLTGGDKEVTSMAYVVQTRAYDYIVELQTGRGRKLSEFMDKVGPLKKVFQHVMKMVIEQFYEDILNGAITVPRMNKVLNEVLFDAYKLTKYKFDESESLKFWYDNRKNVVNCMFKLLLVEFADMIEKECKIPSHFKC